LQEERQRQLGVISELERSNGGMQEELAQFRANLAQQQRDREALEGSDRSREKAVASVNVSLKVT
jgi:hypothetical protein